MIKRFLFAALLGTSASLGSAYAAQSLPLEQLSHIHGMAVDPEDSSRLYLATHEGLYRVSTDGTAVPVSELRADFMGFSPHPDKAEVFYASGHPAGGGNLGFIVSTDGGQTWQQRSAGAHGPVDFHAMAVSRGDPDVVYGTHGGLQVSRDAGQTWEVVGPLPGRVLDLAVPGEPDTVYAGTDKGLLVSQDGGRNWKPAHMFQAPTTLVESGPGGELYAFMVQAGLMRQQDGQWARLANDQLGDRYLLHLAVAPDDAQRLYGVTQHGELLASTDGGQTWQPYQQ